MPLRNPSTSQAGKGTEPEAGQPQCLPATLALRVPRPQSLPTLSMNNKSFLVYTVFLGERTLQNRHYIYTLSLLPNNFQY